MVHTKGSRLYTPLESGTSRGTELRMRHTWRSSCTLQDVLALNEMASSVEVRDILQVFDEHASLVGRAQEAEDLLQQLGTRFRGLQARMLLEFSLNRRDVIAVMPPAGACSAAGCMCAPRQRMAILDAPSFLYSPSYAPTSLCCGWMQVEKASL